MAGFCRRLRYLATRAAFAAAMAFALVPSADAQWGSPFGAAAPGEIVERLRAEGYVLIGPLRRRDTIYLADVAGGPAGRERLVIDAWSGEILQRFVARRGSGWPGGYVPEGGEFNEPPPLGPPPARDFREGNYGSGPGESLGGYEAPRGYEAPPKAKARSRPAATARKGGESKQAAPAVEPRNAGIGNPGVAPTAAAPTGAVAPGTAASPPAAAVAPSTAEPAKAESSPPNTASEPGKGAPPKSEATPSSAATQAKETAPPARPAPANPPPTSAEKPGEKKVNDVPVNPLD